jgi:hypothetical protein
MTHAPTSLSQPGLYLRQLEQLKAACICMRLYRNGLGRWVRGVEIVKAVASSGGIAGWVVWKDYPLMWAGIIASAPPIWARAFFRRLRSMCPCRGTQPFRVPASEPAKLRRYDAAAKRGIARQNVSMFWTLVGNQVGKALLDGWMTVIVPLVNRGAVIWPFAGPLGLLASPGRVILAETYPAEAYGHVGVSFRKRSKTIQSHRAEQGAAISQWAAKNGVAFTSICRRHIDDGFGSDRVGEDRFDALLGLLGMIEVVEQRRHEGRPDDQDILRWEGWILGQSSARLRI